MPTQAAKRLAFVGLGLLTSLLAGAVHAQCRYEVTVIQAGPPNCDPLPPSNTFPNGINDSAQVVGEYVVCALGGHEAFLWEGGPTTITLVPPPGYAGATAWDINDAGLIVGTMGTSAPDRAFLYDGIQFNDLGTLPGGTISRAFAINANDRIVGTWGGPGKLPSLGAFLWQDDTMIDLNALLGTPKSEANDINDAGQIVGWMGRSLLIDGEPFVWHDDQVTALGQVSGSYFATAEAINEVGQVVGWAVTEQSGVNETRPFLWTSGEMIDLGVLPGAERSGAIDINNAGLVVGQAWGGGASTNAGFIWQDGVMTDLNDLIPDVGVEVRSATAINNHGEIAGWAVVNVDDLVGVFLTPIHPPGDLNGDCSVGIVDFLGLLAAWGSCSDCGACPADFDGDCSVGILDFLIMLGNWG